MRKSENSSCCLAQQLPVVTWWYRVHLVWPLSTTTSSFQCSLGWYYIQNQLYSSFCISQRYKNLSNNNLKIWAIPDAFSVNKYLHDRTCWLFLMLLGWHDDAVCIPAYYCNFLLSYFVSSCLSNQGPCYQLLLVSKIQRMQSFCGGPLLMLINKYILR